MIIVIGILGFLVAMIAPNFADITDSVPETVTDYNITEYKKAMDQFKIKENKLPDGLTNIVNETGTDGTYTPLTVADEMVENPEDDDAEPLSKRLQRTTVFTMHILNAAEAEELKALGISKVYNLNPLGEQPELEQVSVAANLGVAMVGCGATDADANITLTATEIAAWTDAQNDEFLYPVGNPQCIGRIVLGMGENSELLTGGYILNAPHCAYSMVKRNDYTYGEHMLILPRLDATVARMDASVANQSFTITEDYTIDPDGQQEDFIVEKTNIWEYIIIASNGFPTYHNKWWTFD
jgi:type II secretory pathway pseudopilin PulG